MHEIGVRQYARILGIKLEGRPSDSGWLPGRCPFAEWHHAKGTDNSMSFAIHVHPEKRSYFKCLACHTHGSLPKLAYDLGRLRGNDNQALGKEIELAEITKAVIHVPEWEEQYDRHKKNKEVKLPDPSQEFAYPRAIGHPYLTQRGIGWKTTYRLGLRIDYEQKRILFPVKDERGNFRGFTGRYYGTAPITKWNPRVRDYLGLPKRELLLGNGVIGDGQRLLKPRRLVVVEGAFDFARTCGVSAGCGWAVFALLGSEVTPQKIKLLLSYAERYDAPIVWMTDNDLAGSDILFGKTNIKTGQRDTNTGIIYTLYGRVPQMTVTYPDGKKDPADCTRLQLRDMVENAELFLM